MNKLDIDLTAGLFTRPFLNRGSVRLVPEAPGLEVDRLLAEGNIDEAESYMESRRIYFWENGYLIRRLNQAYFAFHGSYAAQPGGAAGEEGVDLGEELRQLKERTLSYRDFMRLVAWKWRLDQFEALFKSSQLE